MNPAFLLLLILVGAPLVELYVLIEVGGEIGALPTIGLSIFTAVLGAWLVRLQGLSVLFRVRQTLARGETPAVEMLEGALLMMAGVLLLFPGFITDALGFLVLVSPLRRALVRAVLRRAVAFGPPPGAGGGRTPDVRVIEGEYRREKE